MPPRRIPPRAILPWCAFSQPLSRVLRRGSLEGAPGLYTPRMPDPKELVLDHRRWLLAGYPYRNLGLLMLSPDARRDSCHICRFARICAGLSQLLGREIVRGLLRGGSLELYSVSQQLMSKFTVDSTLPHSGHESSAIPKVSLRSQGPLRTSTFETIFETRKPTARYNAKTRSRLGSAITS